MTKREISPKQKKAIAALLSGCTYTEAASAAGVNKNTITDWLKTSNFADALEAAENEVMGEITRSLVNTAKDSIKVLIEIRDNILNRASARNKAAEILLDHSMRWIDLNDIRDQIERIKRILEERGQDV